VYWLEDMVKRGRGRYQEGTIPEPSAGLGKELIENRRVESEYRRG
jgi:hypothetical protein